MLDGRAFTAAYRGAAGVIHEPGWVLMSIDGACAQNLMAWALMVLGEVTPRLFVPTVPTLSPGEALAVGTMFELARW